jgi:pimeloyl-ACP methyl ester carboxylesterase
MNSNSGEVEQPKVEQVQNTVEAPPAEEKPEENFNDKFPRQTMEFPNGKVMFREIKPETLREGGNIPMVMMTGWAMNQEVIGNTTKGLYESGQTVVPFDIEGGGKGVKGVEDSLGEINRQGELLKKWMESRGDEKFNLVGQSMSALVVLAMIENNPEIADKIASVVLVSPMGLGGKDNLPSLIKRQMAETKRNSAVEKTDESKVIEKRVAKSFKDFLLHHPIRAAKEGFAMAGSDEYDVLNLLRDRGLKVGIIQGAQDQLNSNQRVVENIARQAVANSNVRPELIGEDGMEKIPDELKIFPTDTKEEVLRKQKAIFDIKMELNRTENPVPIDTFKFVEGGHEIFGPEAIAKKILRTVDYLSEDSKKKQIEQQDAHELSQTREELAREADELPENPLQ